MGCIGTYEFYFHYTVWKIAILRVAIELKSRYPGTRAFRILTDIVCGVHMSASFVTSSYQNVMGLSVCFLQQGNDLHRPAAQMSRTRDRKPSMRSVWREDGHLSLEVTATQEGVML